MKKAGRDIEILAKEYGDDNDTGGSYNNHDNDDNNNNNDSSLDFNIVCSTYRHGEENASEELEYLLEDMGDETPESEITAITGIVLGKTTLDPFKVVESLKKMVSDEPWQVRHILRVIPIEQTVVTDLGNIRAATRELAFKILKDDTFRITVEKRHTPLSSSDIIRAVADEIKSKVNLENPSWVILIQVLGKRTGISILKPDHIFSSVIEKRKQGDQFEGSLS